MAINPTELKQVKGCETSREVWLKLKNIYQSRGPARKATLLKQLALQRMDETGVVRSHIDKFFDAVDKLNEMDVVINSDLLAIMLLYSLPSRFENFRCAIESRDELPTLEVLKLKIIEESEARKNEIRAPVQNALAAGEKNHHWHRENKTKQMNNATAQNDKETRSLRCHRGVIKWAIRPDIVERSLKVKTHPQNIPKR